jgi:Mg-chelatase subunit ChlD
MMKDGDSFGLVTFSSMSDVAFKVAKMNAKGRAAATAVVDTLRTKGSTNLWAGLRDGLKLAEEAATPNVSSAVMLLTDGVPNQELGLDDVIAEYPNTYSTVATFGFGYALKSQLLLQISEAFRGTYLTGCCFSTCSHHLAPPSFGARDCMHATVCIRFLN